MRIGDYEIVSQIGVDRIGVRFRVRDESGSCFELIALNRRCDRGVLWDRWVKRLKIIRLIDHPSLLPITTLATESEPPHFVVPPVGAGCLQAGVGNRGPVSVEEAIALAAKLTGAVAEAHRFGVAHGALAADRVELLNDTEIRLDLTATMPSLTAPLSSAADFSADVEGCGRIVGWLLGLDRNGRVENRRMSDDRVSDELRVFISRLCGDSSEKPSMSEVADRFANESSSLLGQTLGAPPAPEIATLPSTLAGTVATPSAPRLSAIRVVNVGDRLGRFRLREELGRGGMGTVFRATDEADGTTVAVKVMHVDMVRADYLVRFRREAQLLAEANSPYVTNLLEFNEDDGVPYLVMEFVTGTTLQSKLNDERKLEEATAVAIMADVCRALSSAHRRGIVHRDVKPDNILLTQPDEGRPADAQQTPSDGAPPGEGAMCEPEDELAAAPRPRARLLDFGIARHLSRADAMHVTQTGAILGTPLYMSPEQCEDSRATDTRSDVYSVGATLFHLLAGRPPFLARSFADLIRLHSQQTPPSLRTLDNRLSESVCDIVDRSLARQREQRYRDADDLLQELDRLLHGTGSAADNHPHAPSEDGSGVLAFSWSWDLQSSPMELWPYVSNTDRFNRAVGLPAVRFSDIRADSGRMERWGQFTLLGMKLAWREHPFEWVEPHRFGVLRQYTHGPFHWMSSVVEMSELARGTRLTHTVRVRPKGWLGRLLAMAELRFRTAPRFEAVYGRIDGSIANSRDRPARNDSFETPMLTRAQWLRLEAQLQRLRDAGVSPSIVHPIGDYLAEASPQEVARIRPIALARHLEVREDELLDALLHATHHGLLALGWDILCPVCRVSSAVQDRLQAVRDHEFCPVCDVKYSVDPASSVELIFRVHESIRPVEHQTYCIGGPAHLPHVLTQLALRPSERLTLNVMLPPGAYSIYVVGDTLADHLAVVSGALANRVEWRRSQAGRAGTMEVRPDRMDVTLHNDLADEVIVRIERTARRDDAFVAAQAVCLPLFRKLFPQEVLSAKTLFSLSNVVVLAAHSDLPEDLRVFAFIVEEHGGIVFEVEGNGEAAAFHDPVSAVQAAWALSRADNSGTPADLRTAVHGGQASVTGGGRSMRYLGPTVDLAQELSRLAKPKEVVLTSAISSQAVVAEWAATAGVAFHGTRYPLGSRPELAVLKVTDPSPAGEQATNG